MVKLSVAGSLVNLAEWGAFEIVAFSTSYLSTTQYVFRSYLAWVYVVHDST